MARGDKTEKKKTEDNRRDKKVIKLIKDEKPYEDPKKPDPKGPKAA